MAPWWSLTHSFHILSQIYKNLGRNCFFSVTLASPSVEPSMFHYLCDISTCTSHRHLKVNKFKTELLIVSYPRPYTFHLTNPTLFSCLSHTLGRILDSSLSFLSTQLPKPSISTSWKINIPKTHSRPLCFLHPAVTASSLKVKVKVNQLCPTLCNPMD